MVQHCSLDVFLFRVICWVRVKQIYGSILCVSFASRSLHASSADLHFEASRTNINVSIVRDIAK